MMIRYTVLRRPKSYVVWDRHNDCAASGYFRNYIRACERMNKLNGQEFDRVGYFA